MRWFSSALSLIVLLAGCAGDGSGSCSGSAECEAGEVCVDGTCAPGADGGEPIDAGDQRDSGTGPETDAGDTDAAPEPDAGCGGESIALDFTPPNILLVMDRSCSMRRFTDGSDFGTGPEDPETRWNIARNAISQLTARYPNRVNWGLMAFPAPRMTCGDVPAAEVLPQPVAGARILDALTAPANELDPFVLCGLDNTDTTTQPRTTPTLEALTAAGDLPVLLGAEHDDYVLLITDGGVSCGTTTEELTGSTSSLLEDGITVPVIGFSAGAAGGIDTLNAIAAAGGLPADGDDSYYVAEDGEALEAVLDSIVGASISCSLSLESTPESDEMRVSVGIGEDTFALTRDNDDGFTYDAENNRIVLGGMSCENLRRGVISWVSVAFGCAVPECVPTSEVDDCNGFDEDCDGTVDEDCII